MSVCNLADYRRLRPAAKAHTDVLAVDAGINIEGMTARELLAFACRLYPNEPQNQE